MILNGCQHTPHVMCRELKRKGVPKTVAVWEVGDIWQGKIRNGIHRLERKMMHVWRMGAEGAAHRAGQAGGRVRQMGGGRRVGVGGTDDGGMRHGWGKRSQGQTVEVPERLATHWPVGGPRPGRVQGPLALLLSQQAALYQPLGADGQLGVNVALAQRHHARSCGHRGIRSSATVRDRAEDTRTPTGGGGERGWKKDNQVLGLIQQLKLKPISHWDRPQQLLSFCKRKKLQSHKRTMILLPHVIQDAVINNLPRKREGLKKKKLWNKAVGGDEGEKMW